MEWVRNVIVTIRLRIAVWRRSRPGRAWTRYNQAGGPLLAGGIAYTALFSIFGALALGLTALMVVAGHNSTLKDAVVATIDSTLPGVLRTQANPEGLISIDALTLDSALNLGSLTGAAVLAYAAIGLVAALSRAIQAMFAIPPATLTWWERQWRAAAGLGAVALAVIASSLLALASGWLTARADAGIVAVLLSALATLAAGACDLTLIATLIRLSGATPPRRDLLIGAAAAALAFTLLRFGGVEVVSSAVRNPLLASFATLAALIAWLHLGGRIILLACAWIANPPAPGPAPVVAPMPAAAEAT